MAPPTKYPGELAIPLPSDEEIRGVIGSSYDPDRALNVVKMFAGAGDLYPATIGLVKAIFSTEGISSKAREMIILRAAKVLDVPYEWQANEQMARNAGLTAEEIKAAASDGPVKGIDPEYVLLCQATDELSTTGTLTDWTLGELQERYNATLCRKYILVISWFNLLSRFLNGCRVPLETTDKIGARTSPLE